MGYELQHLFREIERGEINADEYPHLEQVLNVINHYQGEDIKELRGKCFAFGSEMSTQGHLIPRSMLEEAGITLNDLGKYIYTFGLMV